MESQDKSEDLMVHQQDIPSKEISINEQEFEECSNIELIRLLRENKDYCVTLVVANEKLNESVCALEKSLDEQYEKCKTLEEDKSFLRKNIKKASANWFGRKSKLSEGESDICSAETTEEENSTKGSDFNRCELKKSHIYILNKDGACWNSDLMFKNEELELSNRRCEELSKRLKDYENVIDDQEFVIHGLEKQLDTYFNDNKSMSKQLAALHKLFVDLESINEKQVKEPEAPEASAPSPNDLPTDDDFKGMSGSIAKTYMKLKELIYEKKSLLTEIERLRTLNVELQNRVSTQETRLIRVSDALQTTWLLVSNLKDEHEKIHTAETILRYELKEKRQILQKLKNELECTREQWHIIRQKNSETEQEWNILRDEINERRRLRKYAEENGNTSVSSEEVDEAAKTKKEAEKVFEPPIDLLVDMGIEYGVLDADDEESDTAIALLDGEDVHEGRLQVLEEQCCFLYQKLMSSTSRALTLASHLSSLHEQYSLSDEEDNEDDEQEHYFEEYEDMNIHETDVVSPDSESYDTAYVSETDGAESASGLPDTTIEIDNLENEVIAECDTKDTSEIMDENDDVLSRRLITFLPRKIEILKSDIVKLEEKVQLQQEEKVKLEATLTAAVEFERKQNRKLQEQLSHLGKCVDELKLERNGRIAEVEDQLRKKVDEVEKEEQKHIELKEEFEKLSEKFNEREDLLQLTSSSLEQTEIKHKEKLREMQEDICRLEKELLETSNKRPTASQSSQTEHNLEIKCNCTIYPESTAQAMPSEETKAISDTKPNEDALLMSHQLLQMSNQLRRMELLPDTSLKFIFNLSNDSVLCWSFYVAPQEITFSITFDDIRLPGNYISTAEHLDDRKDFSTIENSALQNLLKNLDSTTVHLSKELFAPHTVEASTSSTTGRIVPKNTGRYSLVFENNHKESQEVLWKFWIGKHNCDDTTK